MHDQSVFYLQEQVYSCHSEVRIISFQILLEMMGLLDFKTEEEVFIFFSEISNPAKQMQVQE
jgi:hypothetical protein